MVTDMTIRPEYRITRFFFLISLDRLSVTERDLFLPIVVTPPLRNPLTILSEIEATSINIHPPALDVGEEFGFFDGVVRDEIKSMWQGVQLLAMAENFLDFFQFLRAESADD